MEQDFIHYMVFPSIEHEVNAIPTGITICCSMGPDASSERRCARVKRRLFPGLSGAGGKETTH